MTEEDATPAKNAVDRISDQLHRRTSATSAATLETGASCLWPDLFHKLYKSNPGFRFSRQGHSARSYNTFGCRSRNGSYLTPGSTRKNWGVQA